MNRNVYMDVMSTRSNPVKAFIYGLFSGLVSLPRICIEPFSRTEFGERYFSFSTCCIYAFVLGMFPLVFLYAASHDAYIDFTIGDLFLHYTTWYVYLIWFMQKCIGHWKEIKQNGSTFDFERYSKSSGEINDFLYEINYKGKYFTTRQIQTMIEPGLFFLIGLGLTLMTQWIGIVILISSVCYSVSYFESYRRGDNYVLDFIDHQIANEETVNLLIKDAPKKTTRGFEIMARKPADRTLRFNLARHTIGYKPVIKAV
ncbi:MAG: hypothetical protein EOP48_21615 [Sphingobacteriales bacterium]|nr:MAG: hypothetical protein EOP48_21615 [Sphingobacteriales bacterium]